MGLHSQKCDKLVTADLYCLMMMMIILHNTPLPVPFIPVSGWLMAIILLYVSAAVGKLKFSEISNFHDIKNSWTFGIIN